MAAIGGSRKLLADLADYPDGLPRALLLARARALFPGQADRRLNGLIDTMLAEGHLIDAAGTLSVTGSLQSTATLPAASSRGAR
jgi:hypothetical protein